MPDTDAQVWPHHALALDRMPASWRPAGGVHATLRQTPWTKTETRDAARAVRMGLDELVEFVCCSPARMRWLADDAVECFLNISYSAGNMPALKRRARQQARAVLEVLLAPYVGRDPASVTWDEHPYLICLAIYAHALYPTGAGPTEKLVALTNAATRECGSLEYAMGYDYHKTLAAKRVSVTDLYDLAMWTITFIDAQLVPGLIVPAKARALVPKLWRFFESYPFKGARTYRQAADNDTFYDAAYLATHVGYIPTGYGRHALAIEDAPWLYGFLRENFYPVLDMGELDLVAEFVDLLRQTGCTPANDLQVRDGTRYLLGLFHAAGDSWLAHRESYETGRPTKYDDMHRAWTGIAGVRHRVIEPARPGTYASVFRGSV